MAEKTIDQGEKLFANPKVCKYEEIFFPKNEEIRNENPDWLKNQDPIPLWSRLTPLSCTGRPREAIAGDEKNFMVEISGRLISIFGSDSKQMGIADKMETMNNVHFMSNLFALCTVLKNDFSEWSEQLIDKITTTAIAEYAEFLKKHSLRDQEVNINHFNGSFKFNGDEFSSQIYQVATGVLYAAFGRNQFNLARALSWFFNRYQFGFIKCGQRTLAVGRVLNNEPYFFMYDCQSRGYPMFANQQKISYILRTSYLQILLYCILKTFNFTEKINFILYNVNITIINALETRVSQQAAIEAMLTCSTNNLQQMKASTSSDTIVQKSIQKKVPVQKSVPKVAQKNLPKRTRNNPAGRKPNSQYTSTITNSKPESSSSQQINRKIILDPNKMYYIVAVPKTRLVTAKLESKHLIVPKADTCSAKSKAKTPVNKEVVMEFEGERVLESINLDKSASTATLTNETEEANVIKNPENLGLKVYLVEHKDNQDLTDPNSVHKIKIAHQLRDFFIQ